MERTPVYHLSDDFKNVSHLSNHGCRGTSYLMDPFPLLKVVFILHGLPIYYYRLAGKNLNGLIQRALIWDFFSYQLLRTQWKPILCPHSLWRIQKQIECGIFLAWYRQRIKFRTMMKGNGLIFSPPHFTMLKLVEYCRKQQMIMENTADAS